MARAFDAKAKAKRQKIIAAVGGVILVALLIWRVPQVIALMNEKPPPPPTPVTTPAPGVAAPVSPNLPPATSPDSGDLVDSDPAPVAGAGQLVSFDRFVSKDPFVPQAGKRCADSSGSTIACPMSGPGSGRSPRPPIKVAEPELNEPARPPSSKPAARSSARISVNGETQSVLVGATFPSVDPVFKLVSVAAKSARIAIDGGTYASGAATTALKRGEPVTLVNTADGTRYRLLLL